MGKSKEDIESIIKAFRSGISARDIANMYGMKRENVYSFLRLHMGRDEYNRLTVSRRSEYDDKLSSKRASIIADITSGVPIEDIAKSRDMSEFAVRYYYYKYIKPSDRKKYLSKVDAKTEQVRLKKVAKIKDMVNTLRRVRSVEKLADIEGKKYNTMWVYLRRNRKIIESLTGMEYSSFLTSIRGYEHDIDVESILESSIKAREANQKG